jgi:iron-regulated transporter 1
MTDDAEAPGDTAAEAASVRGTEAMGGLGKLYCSRFLTAWGDRLWAFGLGLLLFKVRPEDLRLVSVYGLVNCVASIVCSAHIGNWIDSTTRMRAAKTFLVVQNVSVALACCVLASYFHWRPQLLEHLGPAAPILAAVVAIALAVCSTLASMGSKIVVEKDWIVIIASGDVDRLAKMNSIFRTIDLVCLTLTPTLAGLLFDFTSYVVVAIAIGGWNVISVFLEFLLLVSIYRQFPGLSAKKAVSVAPDSKSGLLSSLGASLAGWKFYFRHHTMLAGLGLALLYMTVLGFDSTTWAFILMQCVPEALLGGLVAVSALVGLLGSLLFPPLRRRLGLERAGVLGMSALVGSLTLCVASVWLPGSPFDPSLETEDVSTNSTLPAEEVEVEVGKDCDTKPPTSVVVLVTGIIVARFGLWMADLAISQVQQEQVEEEKRGVVGGVQSGLQQFFNMAKFGLVIMMPQEHMFGLLILLSFTFVSLGMASMVWYAGLRGRLGCCPGYRPAPTTEVPEEAPRA